MKKKEIEEEWFYKIRSMVS